MKTIELSKLNPDLDSDEVVSFLLDNGYDSVVDDTIEYGDMKYSYELMYDIWDMLKTKITSI
jgi:hypothetical protein